MALLPHAARAEDIPLTIARPLIERFSTNENALPDDGVLAIAKLAPNRLFVSTFGGVVEFDGIRWTPSPYEKKFAGATVNGIAVSSDTEWFATSGAGLWRHRGESWVHYTTAEGLASNNLVALVSTENAAFGRVCAASLTDISCGDGEKWTTYKLPNPSAQIHHLAFSPTQKRLWIGATTGAYFLEHGEVQLLKSLGELNVLSVGVSNHDAFWAGTSSGAFRVAGDKITHITALPSQSVWAIKPRPGSDNEVMWLATGGGFAVADGDHVTGTISATPFGAPPAFSEQMWTEIAEGTDSVWIGDGERGLFHLVVSPFRHFAADEKMGSGSIRAVGSGPDHSAYAYFGGSGLFHVDAHTLRKTSMGWPTLDDELTNLTTEGATLLAGTRRGKIYRLPVSAKTGLPLGRWSLDAHYPVEDKNGILSLAIDRSTQDLWVGRVQGIARVSGDDKNPQPSPAPPATDYSFIIGSWRDPAGEPTTWATIDDHGLARFRDGHWTLYSKESGHLPNNAISTGIYEERQGKRFIWLAHKNGLTRLTLDDHDNPTDLLHITSESQPAMPPSFGFIYAILARDNGEIWATTNKGVVRFASLAPSAQVRVYTMDDGLPSNVCNANGMMEDALNRVWVGTDKGLGVIDTRADARATDQPEMEIRGWAINGVRITPDGEGAKRLGYQAINHVFDFGLKTMFRAKDAVFQSQLVGLDAQPNNWSPTMRREFTTLPAGRYAFKVWGKDFAGNVTEPLEVRFSVPPPPWSTWWAYLSYLVVISATAFAIVRWRLRALQLRAKELEQKVAERTEQLDQQNHELASKNDQLVESNKNADRIFSALAEALAGTVLDGRYRLDEKVGEGGFGAVFRAFDIPNERVVAVKVFRPTAGNDSAASLDRFRQEGVSASRVNHKNAVAVYDSGVSSDGMAYLVMEYLAGGTLASELTEKVKLSLARCAQIAIPVCEALAEAHRSGLVHRDIKPDNVVIHHSPDGTELVKIIDFGVAKLTDRALAEKTLTMTGAVVGTLTYMAPERLENNEYDGRSDVYSVGIMLYQMLAGEPPFASNNDNMFSVVMMHLSKAPAPLTNFDASIPQAVQDAVMHALAKNPADRPTAEAFAEELRIAFAG